MTTRLHPWAWFFVAWCVLPTAFADTPLRHDPFARPALTANVLKTPDGQTASASPDVPWTPTLLAVVVAGKQSMVNVDGTIISVGEAIDGQRLVQVNDQEAVFTKGKKRTVLKIQPANLRPNNERAAQ